MNQKKLIRITTVPMALRYLLPGQMLFMSQNGFEVHMISAKGKELDAVLRNEDCSHTIVPMTRKITPWQDLKCLWQLYKIFKKEKPDIVHTHTPKAGLLGMLAAKFAKVPVRIHTVAGLPLMATTGTKRKLLLFIEKLTYWGAQHVWPNSYSLKTIIEENKLAPTNKLNIIGKGSTNGIDLKRFSKNVLQQDILEEVKQSINFNDRNCYLLCVGRLVADKGIEELVTAFVRLQPLYRNLKLVLVGQLEQELDPLPENIINQIQRNGDIKHIAWSEYVEYYMSIANFFVFPSHREGFPNVLLQAGAMELPIICSKIEGNVDIVSHKKTGLIFEKGNVTEMVELIKNSVEGTVNSLQMAITLRQEIETFYSNGFIWAELANTYEVLLNNRAIGNIKTQ